MKPVYKHLYDQVTVLKEVKCDIAFKAKSFLNLWLLEEKEEDQRFYEKSINHLYEKFISASYAESSIDINKNIAPAN